MKRARLVYVSATLILLVKISSAQVATGTPPLGSFGGGPADVVNLGNLNVHLTMPVRHKSGRGMDFVRDLVYDSSVWYPVGSVGHQSWQLVSSPTIAGWGGLEGAGKSYIGYQKTYTSGQCFSGGTWYNWQTWGYGGFYYYDQAAERHNVSAGWAYIQNNAGTACGPQPNGFSPSSATQTSLATDGSGFSLTVTPVCCGSDAVPFIFDKDGTKINAPVIVNASPGTETDTDRNGNKITSTNGLFTDTLGQTALTVLGSAPSDTTMSYTAPSGATATFRVKYTSYTVQTKFLCSGISDYGPLAKNLVSEVDLPDGTKYTFAYEVTPGDNHTPHYVTGRVSQVTLPTGGTIAYTYTGANAGIVCADGSAAGLTRTLSPGGTWTYTRTQVSGNHWQTKVTSPPDPVNPGSASNDTVIDFQKDSASSYPTNNFYETQRQAYQASSTTGTLLLTMVTCYNGNSSSCTTTGVSSPITSKSVTLQYPSSGLQSKVTTYFNSYGLATEVDQTAYGTTPGSNIRSTYITYASLTNNIFDHPGTVTVTDGGPSGHVLSKTTYTYDEYSTYPLQQTTGTPQHGSISGSRGNATTITSTVIGTTTLTRHFAYFDTGNVYQVYDINGAVTTYNYDNTAQSCGNSFVTSVTLPISGLSSQASTTYDCIGGVATAATDLNGNSSSTSYTDASFWRPASVTAPYTSTATTTTNFTYTAYNPTNGNLGNVESKMLFNGNNSVSDQLTTIGVYGQPLYSQQREGPTSGNYDSTQLLYDSLLRANKSSMPCVYTSTTFTDQNQACPTAATTTSTFDALGRVTQTTDGGTGYVQYTYNQNDVKQAVGPAPAGENQKQKQMEYDALGRLTSVCELTSLTGYAQCGQTNPYNGYTTTYAFGVNGSSYPTTTVTQGPSGSQQTRVYTYDLLGRLISEQNPENGTTTYTYDSDSAGTCSGSYNGDLVKRTDAKGNKICYQYDVLHRLASVSYPSGPDASNTPSKTLVYDSATFNGTAMANPKGRLVEAYTGASGSKTTDEFFNYSVRGELLDTWQCTPHSGTNGCASVSNYYHVTAGFWENGALKTLSSSISGLPSQTYGIDSMGRPNTATASAGQNPVTGVSYDLTNFKTTVTYGSADSDVVTLDSGTGRMTQYRFNVGSQNVTGNLTWNTNGSLGTLAITNQLNSLDTQTCSYTHDDLSRIASVGCLNGSTHRWDQNFTYDAFGNITKNVPNGGTGITFLPTYDPSKNWITALPGVTPTTDANGQMTYDGTHNYTWDAEGKMHALDTTTLTYDALGRMVETAVSSTYTQIVYGPQGRFATMNGQTLVRAFIPSPGAQVVYTSASLNTTNKIAYYRHADHLGSSRLATTPTRTLYSSTAYAPFGEPYSQAGTTDLSFTGQDQDTVSGIHDFPARKYPPVQGRWLSPDPAGLAAVNPASPQSWNRYAYVLNNPLSLVDPLGLDACAIISGSGQCPSDPSASGPGVGVSQNPDLAAITGSGSVCGGGGCGADAYAAYNSWVQEIEWVISKGWWRPGDEPLNIPWEIGVSNEGDPILQLNSQAIDPGAGNASNYAASYGPPDHLIAEIDCIHSLNGVREISYQLQDASNNNLTGYDVTEYLVDRQTGKPYTGGTTGSPWDTQRPDAQSGYSGFSDQLGGFVFRDILQTFTARKPGGPSIPIFIRDINDRDWGTNGIWGGGGKPIYVNSKTSPRAC